MVTSLPYLRESASQTAGPYVQMGLAPGAAGFQTFETELGQTLAPDGVPGPRVTIEGKVFDGLGAAGKDALIEVWQTDANGIHPHPEDPRMADCAPSFRGWGRAISDFETGLFKFETIKPGLGPGRAGRVPAPHLSLWLMSSGINNELNTRMYFPEDASADAADPVLGSIEQRACVATLIATATGPATYRFDIRLPGDGETVLINV